MSASQPGSQSELRAANRLRLIELLRSRGPMTQAELARASGLSPATVSSIAHELRDEEWVIDEDLEGARGRALALSRDAGLAVGIAFGHSHVRVAIADLAHTILAEASDRLDTDHGSADEGIALAASLLRRLVEENAIDTRLVAGVGMGLPGPLRRDTGQVGDSAILPGWIASHPAELMQKELGLEVSVENDANLAALAEIVWGAGRGCSDLLYLKISTGVGGGLILNGRLYHGHAGTAGEIGHTIVDEAGPVCRCGSRGCLETFAGAEAVLEPLRRRHGPDLTIRQVVAMAEDGDAGCRRVIADAGHAVGRAVADACNILAPERVVIGGDLARSGDLLLDPIRAAIARSTIGAMREIPVTTGTLGERADVLGAVALVLRDSERFVAQPG
ncbi:MAG: ROK family protein [Solirubrobacterales bacterium]